MNKEKARSLLLDYVYGEISEDQKKELEAFIEDNPDLQEELDELRQTRTMLQNIPLEYSPHQLLLVEPERRGFLQWLRDVKKVLLPDTASARIVLAATTVIITLFLAASLAEVRINTVDEGWVVSFGAEPPVVQQGVGREALNEMINIIRSENVQLASTFVDEARMEHERQMQEMMDSMLDYFEEQREADLRLISSELAQRDEEYYYRYLQTNENLADLLYAFRLRY